MIKTILKSLLLVAVLTLAACNKDEEILTAPVPVIKGTMDSTYEIKVGRKITIAPTIENGENATYEWKINGAKVGSESSYTYVGKRVGTEYIDFHVQTLAGADSLIYRVDVLPLAPPVVVLESRDGVIEVEVGNQTLITPHYGGGEAEEFKWLLDGEECDHTYNFFANFENVGDHTLSIIASNEDGQCEASATLRVVEHLTGRVSFPPALLSAQNDSSGGSVKAAYRNVALGHTLALTPMVENFRSPEYEWSVDGKVVSNSEVLLFEPELMGLYDVKVTVRDYDGYTLSADVVVECCDVEWTFNRRISYGESSSRLNNVFEYLPAAGQFINEDKSGFSGVTSQAQANEYARKRMEAGEYVSLGGWGGVLVVGFDHSISNGEGYDFSIKGNIHEGSSEPAIVWVMQDTNGNGLPDDVWYELRGSEFGTTRYERHYAVTYYRPAIDKMSVWWSDCYRASGEIERMQQHSQPSYYPEWVTAKYYTLYGSLLEANTTVGDGGQYINNPYAWGYADNEGSDLLGNDKQSCGFDISNAVREDGEPMVLGYIDFVKVQSAINSTSGPLGEVSTEVVDIVARDEE